MATTIEVGKIVNIVSFKVDQNSYNRALKAIKRIAGVWSAATSKMSKPMAMGRQIGGGSSRRSSSSSFMGPMPFVPGTNTRAQAKAARMQAQQSNRAESTIKSGIIGREGSFLAAYSNQIANLNAQLRSGTITTGMYNKQINTMARDFRRASMEGKGLFGTLHDIRGEFLMFTASYTAFAGAAAVVNTGQMFQSIESAMSMTSESAGEVAAKMAFIRSESYRLGLDLKTAGEGFAQLSIGTKSFMHGAQTQELFTGFSEFAKVAGIDAFRFEKSLLGLIQVANKGQLMAEDVKGQIFENMIGSQEAFLTVANKLQGKEGMMGMEEFLDKMQKGQFLAKDFLPLLGKYFHDIAIKGGRLQKRLESNETAMMRLKTTWMDFQNSIFTGGFESAVTRLFNKMAIVLRNNKGFAEDLGYVLGELLKGFTYFGAFVHDTAVYVNHMLVKYLIDPMKELLGIQGELNAGWELQAAGVLIAVGSFAKLASILAAIVGSLLSIKKLLPGVAGATTGGAATTAGTAGAAAGASRLFGLLPMSMAIGEFKLFHDYVQWQNEWMGELFNSMFGSGKPQMRSDMRPSLQGNMMIHPALSARSEYVTKDSPTVKVSVDGSEFSKILKIEIEDNNNKMTNLFPSD